MHSYSLSNLVDCCNVAGIPPPEGSDDAQLLTMSTLNEDGVMNVKQVACDRLLSSRVETKLQVCTGCCCCYCYCWVSPNASAGLFLSVTTVCTACFVMLGSRGGSLNILCIYD